MATTTFSPVLSQQYSRKKSSTNFLSRFFAWCEKQEPNRMMWTCMILPAQAFILAPFTMILAMLSGINFMLFIPVIAAIVITFISNLAAMPTKVAIPIFALSVLIDIAVIASAFIMGMEPSRLFG